MARGLVRSLETSAPWRPRCPRLGDILDSLGAILAPLGDILGCLATILGSHERSGTTNHKHNTKKKNANSLGMSTSFWGAVYGRALLGMCSAILSAVGAGSSSSSSGGGGASGGSSDAAPLSAATGTRAFALGLCAGSGATALLWKIQKAGSVGVTSHPALLPCVGAGKICLASPNSGETPRRVLARLEPNTQPRARSLPT